MDGTGKHDRNPLRESLFNATTVVVLGQVGFLTIVIILIAFGSGWLLDRWFDTRPVFTIVVLVASIPISLFATVRTVKRGMKRREVRTSLDERNDGNH